MQIRKNFKKDFNMNTHKLGLSVAAALLVASAAAPGKAQTPMKQNTQQPAVIVGADNFYKSDLFALLTSCHPQTDVRIAGGGASGQGAQAD